MIVFINNNKIKIKINIKDLIDKNIVCLSVNDIINNLNSKKINKSIILLSIDNIKILNILRHSSVHLMAHAIKNIYKNIHFAVGPVIKNGFYYDFFTPKKISVNELNDIEKEMEKISKKSFEIKKYNISIKGVEKLFKNNKYKINILKNIHNKQITIYKQSSFLDLCLGPHLINTKFIKNFKLLKISGAYWKNNNKNNMLVRIYGTAWNTHSQLNQFIELKKNTTDHKKLGLQLNLFYFDERSHGVVFWNKNGWIIYKNLIKYIKKQVFKNRFIEVNTPTLLNSYIFDKSGHTSKFNENMFKCEQNNTTDFLKPMNCPCHITIFNNFNKKSYKDLPYRISEFGSCFRNEISGSLHGLMRLKNFTQDDGHIFCLESQIYHEIIHFIKELKNTYFNLGFKIYKVTLSKKPNHITEEINIWNSAEKILEKTINDMNIKYNISNDGAFYGPKLEFALKDKVGRYWQCGTIQVDFFSSKRLNASYSDKCGSIKTPIILHRALLGSIERFLGILIENEGIPFILNPTQFEILYVNDKYLKYAKKIYNVIIKNYSVKLNVLNERLDYKIKKCILEKIPYIIVIGENETVNNTLSIRCILSNNFINIKFNKFIRHIKIKKKGIYY